MMMRRLIAAAAVSALLLAGCGGVQAPLREAIEAGKQAPAPSVPATPAAGDSDQVVTDTDPSTPVSSTPATAEPRSGGLPYRRLEWRVITDGQLPASLRNEVEKRRTTKGTASFKSDGLTYVLITAGEKGTGGYAVQINAVGDGGNGKVEVIYTISGPAPGQIVTEAITYPYVVAAIESDLPVEFHEEVPVVAEEVKREGSKGTMPASATYVVIEGNSYPSEVAGALEAIKYEGGTRVVTVGRGTYALIALGEKPTSGYSVDIRAIGGAGNEVEITYSAGSPAPGSMNLMVITYPVKVIHFPGATDLHVKFHSISPIR